MAKQYHYVVVFDEATGEWSVDYDVSLNFDNGHIWDEEAQTWSAEYNPYVEDVLVEELTRKLNAN